MGYWIKFWGWVAFMVVATSIIGATAKDGVLFGSSGSTVIAGVIQAVVAGVAIVFSGKQAKVAYEQKIRGQRIDEWRARSGRYNEALSMVELAQARLKALAGAITNPKLGHRDAAQFAIDSVQMHVDAFARFPFEQLDPVDAKIFETGYQSILYARSTARGLLHQIDTRRASDEKFPLSNENANNQDRAICAEEFSDVATGMMEAVNHLRTSLLKIALEMPFR